MGVATGSKLSGGRYRRRIVGWGAAALGITLAIGSATTLSRVEDDLRTRVTGALDAAGVDGVVVSFSGQDGTIACEAPLDDPDTARRVAGAERGVRSVELAATCRDVADDAAPPDDGPATDPASDPASDPTSDPTADPTADPTTDPGEGSAPVDSTGGPDDTSGETGETGEPPPTVTTAAPTTTEPAASSTSSTMPADPTTVLDILLDDPQFSVLKNALEAVDLGDVLGGADPVTIFAPTDDAFALLGPNFNAALASDPDSLLTVLRHHVVPADLPSADLTDGPLTMSDGTEVDVDTTSGIEITSGEVTAAVVDADLDAVNGRVHVVDKVLLPEGIDVGVVADVFSFVARYDDGTMVLSGRVASTGQRARLLDAARRFLSPANVVDQLEIDAEAPIESADVDALVELVALVPRDLVVGEIVVSIDGIFVTGVHVDRTAIDAVADRFGASTGLTERPPATAAGAASLERQLNDVVSAAPIRFEPASADLVVDAEVFDRLAAIAKLRRGVQITVEGHTDSDGTDEVNDALSQARAEAVVEALIQRGVPRGDLLAVGLGSAEPVLVDGVEDKVASRRVEFEVGTE